MLGHVFHPRDIISSSKQAQDLLSHFTEKKTEAQRGNTICLRSPSSCPTHGAENSLSAQRPPDYCPGRVE